MYGDLVISLEAFALPVTHRAHLPSLARGSGLRARLYVWRRELGSQKRAILLGGMLMLQQGCNPFRTTFDQVEPAISYRASRVPEEDVSSGSHLRIMTYNVKFGGGRIDFFFDCHGDRVLMTEEEVLTNLAGLSEKIRQVDPDIVFLQEVDVNSKRSFHIDQVQWLLDNTELTYGAYASQWKADYVPSDGIGPVDSGNAILSKYPLSRALRLALPLRDDQGGLTRYFYLRRNLLQADVTVPDSTGATHTLRLVATHAAAYAKDGTKKEHINAFLEQLDTAEIPVIGGGDLNTLPPQAPQLSDFADSVCTDEDFVADDYSGEVTWLEPLYERYSPAIPLERFRASPGEFATHTTDKNGFWNRKLDYLFTDLAVIPGSGLVHQDRARGGMTTMSLSDHAPVTMEVRWP